MFAKIDPANSTTFSCAGERLRKGELVAFPTETVYGLGAHALDAQAIEKIFVAKGRPKTDPLIVHVLSIIEALDLAVLDGAEHAAFEALATAFWPGPLTLVVRAQELIPKNVTAGGIFVGLRAPAHDVARELLRVSGVPIAAPSANRFGHVSPTTAQHVLNDLRASDVLIIDGGASQVGVESTVLKLMSVSDGVQLEILRPGFITQKDIETCLMKTAIQNATVVQKTMIVSQTEAQQSPGQLLTHYSPRLKCYLWDKTCSFENLSKQIDVSKSVLINFGKNFDAHAPLFFRTFNLSVNAKIDETSQNLFSLLREAEDVVGAEIIVLPNLELADEKWAAVYDRMFRAASGKILK